MLEANRIEMSNIGKKIPGFGKSFGTESFELLLPEV